MGQILFNVADAAVVVGPYTFLLHGDSGSDTQGVVLETVDQSNLGASFTYAYKSAILSDGRVVVHGLASGDPAIRCFDAGTTSLDWEYVIPGSPAFGGDYGTIVVLENGNIVAAWSDSDELGYFTIINSSGSVVKAVTEYSNYGVTGNGSYYGYESMIALPDGGFAIKFETYPGTDTDFLVIYDADGTVRVAAFEIGYADYGAVRVSQFPSGDIIACYGDDLIYSYNPSTGSEVLSGSSFTASAGSIGATPFCMAALPSWTDQIAIVWSISGATNSIYGTIMKDTGTHPVVYDYKITADGSGWRVVDLIALPDGTFLLQYNLTGEYGNKYYILDSSLAIVGDKVTAFTGSFSGVQVGGIIEGCAI